MLDSHRREGRVEIHGYLSLASVRYISMLSKCSNIEHREGFALIWAFETVKYTFYKLCLKYPECWKGYELVTYSSSSYYKSAIVLRSLPPLI